MKKIVMRLWMIIWFLVVFGICADVAIGIEINYNPTEMVEYTNLLPRFYLWGIEPLKPEEVILSVEKISSQKIGTLYSVLIEESRVLAEKYQDVNKIRFQVMKSESIKAWSWGGTGEIKSLSQSNIGLGGGLIPQIGRTKADPIFTIIFMRVE